jgi:hypothetical protein
MSDSAGLDASARPAAASDARVIGRGRSSLVRLVEGPDGPVVEKVFIGDGISNAVQILLTGAPLAYRWNEDAVRAACIRRQILERLMPLWFGGGLRMARARGIRWDGEARAFVLLSAHVEGEAVRLLHPFRAEYDSERRLREEVMPALIARLTESGFFGIVWQAGLGNPKALPNFLFHPEDGSFTLVDQESGVPAVFALGWRAWLTFYGPMTRRFGRPLMDDVDVETLRGYVRDRRAELARLHGSAGVDEIERQIERLDLHQRRWLLPGRRARRQAARARLGRPERTGRRIAQRMARGLAALLRRTRAVAGRFEPAGAWAAARRFVVSQAHRTALGETYVLARIAHWRERGQLSQADASRLEAALRQEREAGRYLTDFGAHLGMKASFFTFEVAALGLLSLVGVPLYLLGLFLVLDGPIYRTGYTGYRCAQNLGAGRPMPFVALGVGLIPFFGTLAFPTQMLWTASGRQDPVARFAIYDSFSRLAAGVPLVGGEDTSLEHRMNRLAHRLVAT